MTQVKIEINRLWGWVILGIGANNSEWCDALEEHIIIVIVMRWVEF